MPISLGKGYLHESFSTGIFEVHMCGIHVQCSP